MAGSSSRTRPECPDTYPPQLLHTSSDWVNRFHVIQTSNWMSNPCTSQSLTLCDWELISIIAFLLETKSLFRSFYLTWAAGCSVGWVSWQSGKVPILSPKAIQCNTVQTRCVGSGHIVISHRAWQTLFIEQARVHWFIYHMYSHERMTQLIHVRVCVVVFTIWFVIVKYLPVH